MSDMTLNIDSFAAMSARDIVGEYLLDLTDKIPEIVVINADLASSSRTQEFAKKNPDRSFNVGIAEQNMVSFAAGLAHEGFKPLVCTMAPFLSMRACEQVRTDICYGGLPVVLMGTYAGYSGSISGATHSGIEDCAIMSSFGGMTVLEPGDPWMVIKMLDAAFGIQKPVYIRTSKEAVEPIYKEDYDYEIGKALTPIDGDDGAFLVSGPCVSMAIEASKAIKEKTGAKIRVVDMHTIHPVDEDAIIAAADTGRIVCAQDHTIVGGLGYHVGYVLSKSEVRCKYIALGIPNKFVPLASTEFLYAENGYDTKGLENQMLNFL